MFIETQLDMEKTKTEQEKKKLAIAQEQITQLVMYNSLQMGAVEDW